MHQVQYNYYNSFAVYNTDHLGSYNLIMDSDTNIVQSYYFDPWGNRKQYNNLAADNTATTFLFDRGSTGYQRHDMFKIINMRARLYDPVIGRFFSPDPYVQMPDNVQNFNRYSYCLNNPLMYTDPSGEIVWFVPVIIGAVIGAYTGGVMANSGQFNPIKWDYSSGKTWGYMFGGAVVGGASGYLGWAVAGSGMPMANTAGIMSSSFTNSVGTHIYTGGQTPVSISFGIGSYDITNNKWNGIWNWGENSTLENIGYTLGALANVSDFINLPFWSGKKKTINADGTITKEPHKVGLTTNNEDWVSHAEVDIDGNTAISWGPTETSYSKLEYLTNVNRGSNSYHSYYGNIDKTLPHISIRANANIVNAYAKFLNNTRLPYNAIFSSCSTHASIGLNLAGAFNLGFIHPYLLHYNMMIMPYLYFSSPYLLNFKR